MEPSPVPYGTMNNPIALLFGTSELRREVLAAFYARPGLIVHPRELARRLARSPQVVARELARLEAAGILSSETVGPARRYQVDGTSPIADPVRALVVKTIGVEARIQAALDDVPGPPATRLHGRALALDDLRS